MISNLSHMTFIVRDLERSARFFTEIFGAREVYSSGDNTFSISREKFLLINDLWICLMEGEALSSKTYNHIAFKIHEDEIERYLTKIQRIGVEIRPERPRIPGEGRSVYFYDFDNHLFELHTGTIEKRLQAYSNHTSIKTTR